MGAADTVASTVEKMMGGVSSSGGGQPSHPYTPKSLDLPNYVPNHHSAFYLLTVLFGAAALVLGGTWVTSGRMKAMSKRLAFMWCIFSGITHVVLEGYYVLASRSLPSKRSLLGEVWKEYALSDSRYMTGDVQLVVLEFLTAFVVGPALLFVANRMYSEPEKPLRYIPALLVLSAMELYGTILYMAPGFQLSGSKDQSFWRRWSNPNGIARPYYFWFYFVFFNLPWIVVPGALIAWGLQKLELIAREGPPGQGAKRHQEKSS